jgi:hypothetical protein
MEIGGADFCLDHICYDTCPDPVTLGHIEILSAEPLNATQRQIVIEIPVTGTGGLQLQRRSTLGGTASWQNHPATITTPTGRPNIRRFTTTVPLTVDKVFFRVKAQD